MARFSASVQLKQNDKRPTCPQPMKPASVSRHSFMRRAPASARLCPERPGLPFRSVSASHTAEITSGGLG